MIFRRNRLVKRVGPGRFEVSFPPNIRDLLVQLGSELGHAVDSDHPALKRLFPTAYPDDPERDAGYQVFAFDALIDQRRDAVALLSATADDTEVDIEALSSWMRVVNDTRLVLGTMLDVSETDEEAIDEEQEEAFEVYEVLGFLLSEIVDALQDDLSRS